jgi:hypothetical protein
MTYAESTGRAAFIDGLRKLADLLESNQEVPAPYSTTTVFVFPPDGSDQERRSAIDAIASLLFTQARTTLYGHYEASRFFGPVEYRAVAIPRQESGNPEGESK